MDQLVAKGDDPAAVPNRVGKVSVKAKGLIKGLSHQFELPLYRRPQKSVSGIVSGDSPSGELSELVTCRSEIEQALAEFKRQHRVAV
jgi:hypothetical protein